MGTITENLIRIQQAKADIKTAIEAKGVEVPSSATIDTYDDYVTAITGGGGGVEMPSKLEGITLNNYGIITSANIKSGVTSIDDGAFGECKQLSAVTIPDSVTSIGYSVFNNCNRISAVTIPSGVTSIGPMAFYYCGSLTSVTIPDSVTYIGYSAFEGCNHLSDVTIPSGLTSIDDGVFYGCESLTAITIPSGVTSIGASAFGNCYGLTSVTFPDSVTYIGNSAFAYCISLSAITIPSGVTSIDDGAFAHCESLTSVTIPDSVTYIGYSAFNGCSSLSGITVEATTPATLGEYAFDETNDCPIYVPAASVATFKSEWSAYEERIVAIPTPVFKNYFRTVSRGNGDIGFTTDSTTSTSAFTSISYSTDSGSTWTTVQNLDNTAVNATVTGLTSGDTVYWKGDGISMKSSSFSASTDYDVEGNIMSLLYDDNFESATTFASGSNYNFSNLFFGDTHLINASGLTLPATTLEGSCYRGMFYNCTSLATAPELPATTLAPNCYYQMFQRCTSLTTAPALPATTLTRYCYSVMFGGCTSLSAVTCLATDISAANCTNNWLNNVSASGVFTKAASMTGWTTGANGIPSGWTVQDYQPTPTGQTWVTIQAGEDIPSGSYVDLRVSSGTVANINDDEYMSIFVDDAYPYITFGSLCTEKQCPEGEEECNCLEEDPETGECIEYDENDCWCNTELECLSHSIGWANTMNEYFDYINEVLYPFTYDNEGYWHLNLPFDVDAIGEYTYTATFDIEVLPATE